MLRIYPSSRYTRAQMWIDLAWKHELHIVAQWVTHCKYDNMTDTKENAVKYWPANLRDIQTCDLVLAYAEEEDVLGGTLIELGAALAYEKPILLVGHNESIRCWRHHPLVTWYRKMSSAITEINRRECYND